MVDKPFGVTAIEPGEDGLTVAPSFPATGGLPITAGLPLLGGLSVRIGRASRAETGEVLTLQRAAYVAEALLYDDARIPPLLQTQDELEAELAAPSTVALTALLGPRMVGAVRAVRASDDRTAWAIGRLVVAPDVQGRGIGRRLLSAIETAAPSDVARYTLFTGHLSRANLDFYTRCGYVETRRETQRNGLVMIHLDKARH